MNPQPTSVDFNVIGAELGLDDQPLDDFEEESSDNAHPLLTARRLASASMTITSQIWLPKSYSHPYLLRPQRSQVL